MINTILEIFPITGWRPIVEIIVLWFVIYHILLFLEGTRAINVLRGVIILLAAFFFFQMVGFGTLDWLLTKLFGISIIAILIIFHPEIRQGLARLGQRHLFGTVLKEEELEYIIQQVVKAAENLAKEKHGALIAIENKVPLNTIMENGVSIDGKVSAELIQAIFTPNNPLHDGGLIIQNGRIMSAACLFPLTETFGLSRMFGTRHRAALGLSEESDAVILVVSEERQDMSIVYESKLYKDLNHEELAGKIKEFLNPGNG